MSSPGVTVIILHAEPGPTAGPLVTAVAAARHRLATRHVAAFRRAGADDARIAAARSDERSFGARLVAEIGGRAGRHGRGQGDGRGDSPRIDGGLVVLGSGAVPLASGRDLEAFVAAARAGTPSALANNRYSADIVAISCAAGILHAGAPRLADLASDNALPRWLAEAAGVPVADLAARWRLAIDLDGPLDLLLVGGDAARDLTEAHRARVTGRLDALADLAADPAGELVVAGRTSATTIAWLERHAAARVRVLVEERGLRTRQPEQRPARSVLGMVLDRDGPGAIGDRLAEVGDGALIDSRVLLAHRFGAAESGWPNPEDRFASDLLLHESIADPWLRDLTASAAEARIPIVLGGHTLVGPGLRLALSAQRRGRR